MKSACCLFFLLLVAWIPKPSKAKVYPTLKEDGPRWLNLDSEKGGHTGRKHSRRRHPRAATDSIHAPNVTKFLLESESAFNQALIHWHGKGSKVILILTRKLIQKPMSVAKSTLWRSTNYGKEYVSMSSHFPTDTILTAYVASTVDRQKVIFIDAYDSSSRIWLSTDEGGTYTSVMVPFSVQKIEFHPTNSNWLLGYDGVHRTLYCSLNFGRTWTKLGDEVSSERYFWYVKDVDVGEGAEKVVHFEYKHTHSSGTNTYKVKSCYVPNCAPTPFQRHNNDLKGIDFDSLVVRNAYIFAQKSDATEKLYVSYKRGPFVKARFPHNPYQTQSDFNVVSSDGECVVMAVSHSNGLAHLYFSDLTGVKFKKSLSNIRYFFKKTAQSGSFLIDRTVFTPDMHEVKGITGTYIANVNSNYRNTTKITWNNGQSWSSITANVTDESGKPLPLCEECSLNLHLKMEITHSRYYIPAILAKKTYPGLIVAHGTFGRTLNDRPSKIKIFISSDNGRSWFIGRRGRHTMTVTKNGTIIVVVKMVFMQAETEFAFSKDYGKTWQEDKFSDESIHNDAVLTEPGEHTSSVTLLGHKNYRSGWWMFQVDMAPVFSSVCSHPNDYENVTFPHLGNRECNLGLIQSVERVKDGKNCLMPAKYTPVITKTPCDCTMKDYECDLGYEQVITGEHKICISTRPTVKTECVDNVRSLFTGFRKISGDRCKNDLNIAWKTELCPTGPMPATSKPTPTFQIELVNNTNVAKVGEHLIFTAKGVAGGSIVWHLLPPHDLEYTEAQHTGMQENFTVYAIQPGTYHIKASLLGTRIFSDTVSVTFWYPLEKVHLYHPPVVGYGKHYNSSAWVETVSALRGNSSLLGKVSYTWNIARENRHCMKKPTPSLENFIVCQAPFQSAPIEISVNAENAISFQAASGKILVEEFVETLVIEMLCKQKVKLSEINPVWLEELSEEIKRALFAKNNFTKVTNKYKLVDATNLFISVFPEESLKVKIYFASVNGETSQNLFQAAEAVEEVIAEEGLVVVLGHIVVRLKSLYIIDHNDNVRILHPEAGAANGPAITAAVILLAGITAAVAKAIAKTGT